MGTQILTNVSFFVDDFAVRGIQLYRVVFRLRKKLEIVVYIIDIELHGRFCCCC